MLPVYCRGIVTGPKRLSCNDERLIDDSCLSDGYPTYEKHDYCSGQNTDMAVNGFGSMLWVSSGRVHLVSINSCGRSLRRESSKAPAF